MIDEASARGSVDVWQVILSFCDMQTLETIFIYGKKEIGKIFDNQHFLSELLQRECVLPELIQPVNNFVHVCQLIRIHQATGSREDLTKLADITQTSAELLSHLLILNGRWKDAVEIVEANRIGFRSIVTEIDMITRLMMRTQRGTIENLVDYTVGCSPSLDGVLIFDVLEFVLGRNENKGEVVKFVGRNLGYLRSSDRGTTFLEKWK